MLHGAIARILTLGLGVVGVLGVGAGECRAHEGHDNPPPVPVVADPNLVVRSMADERYEVVLKYHAAAHVNETHATIYLSDYATNAPIDGAEIRLRATAPVQTSGRAQQEPDRAHPGRLRPGVYDADLPSAQAGDYTLILTVGGSPESEFAVQDLPLGKVVATATSPAPATAAKQHSWPLVPTAVAAVGLGALLFLLARRFRARRSQRPATIALLLLMGLGTPGGRSAGHEGHDLPPATAAIGGAGPRYVPKESQFLLNVRTIVARLESLREPLVATGHVVPESGALATLTAPQTGRFEIAGRPLVVGDHVREGQLLGNLLVIDGLPIRAPIAGLISEVDATPGQWVQAGQTLARILDERRVRVEVPLFGESLARALKARTASVRLSGGSDRSFPAAVRGLAPTASAPEQPSEGSQQAIASPVPPLLLTVSNPTGLLRPGMLVEVSIETAVTQNVLAVPQSAIVYQESGPGIFVHTGAEVFEYRPVGITGRYPTTVGVTGDLKPGERVVTQGAYSLISAPPLSSTSPAGGSPR